MNIKNLFFILFIGISSHTFAQKITFDEVINGDIYSSDARGDRLKNTQEIDSVTMTYYDEDTDTLNLVKDQFDHKFILDFDKKGRLLSKIEKYYNGDVWFLYTYDEKDRLVKIMVSNLNHEKEKTVIEEMTFKYSKDKVDQLIHKDDEFYVRREFMLANNFVLKVHEFEEDNTPVKFRTFYDIFYQRGDFWDYIEGVNPSKEIFRTRSYWDYTYDENGKVTSIDSDVKEFFIYENNSLIVYKVLDSKDNSQVRKAHYEYDAKGNWIKKSYIFQGKLVYYIIRNITYR